MSESGVVGEFTQKIGPLPLYAYVGIGVLGVLVFEKYHKGKTVASTAALAPDDTGTDYSGDTSSTDSSLGYGNTGNGVATTTGTIATANGASITSNAEWAIAAGNYLIAAGVSPQDANAAINGFLAGSPLLSDARSLVTRAIQGVGETPDGPLNIVSAVPTAPPAAKAPIISRKRAYGPHKATTKHYNTPQWPDDLPVGTSGAAWTGYQWVGMVPVYGPIPKPAPVGGFADSAPTQVNSATGVAPVGSLVPSGSGTIKAGE